MSFNYKIIVLTQYLEAYFIITNKTDNFKLFGFPII